MSKKTISVTLEPSNAAQLVKAAKQNRLSVSAIVRLAIGDFLPKTGFDNPLISDEFADIKKFLIAVLEFEQRMARLNKNQAKGEASDAFARLILKAKPAETAQLEESIDGFLRAADALYEQQKDNPKI